MATLSLKRATSAWIISILILFLVSMVFGILMRFSQGNQYTMSPVGFYAMLTTHGITMIGIWTAAGMVGINFLLSRYVKSPGWAGIFALICTIISIAMLWIATLKGQFHAGWTFLYPFPFYIAWSKWATPLFLSGLAVLGIGLLVWSITMLGSIFNKYSFKQAFAWQHISKKKPDVETPPFILISTVSLVGVIISLIAAVILLILFFMEYFMKDSFVNDALLMKNFTYFFGHTLANEALYLGLAALYELMPEVSGRPKFKNTWYIALAWNCTLVFILTAFFHHMYMDFVQPVGFQIVGQFASYFASLPAAAVTAFSVIVLVFGKRIRWSLVNLLFFIGVAGWMIGGIGAVIDATISNNMLLHNTLWVPAHFHTYNAMGNVLFSLAFFVWVADEFAGTHGMTLFKRSKIFLLIIGGFGFVLMFYLAGANSVPRRFSMYLETEFRSAITFARVGGWFAIVYMIAMLLILTEIVRKCVRVFYSS